MLSKGKRERQKSKPKKTKHFALKGFEPRGVNADVP